MSLGRVPVILQFTPTECSAACLAMALGVHGRETTLEEIRESFAPGRDGASALALIEAGTRFGLAGEGVEATVDDLADLPRGTILFWERKHFVVLESATPKGVRIVDPASGRRFLPRAEAEAAFSNVAIMFEPTPELVRGRGARSAVLELLWDALRRHKTLLGVAAFSLVVQLLFASLFFAYAILRARATAWPPIDLPRLPKGLPGVSTGVIALSSLVLARGLAAVRDRRSTRGGWLVLTALVLGLAFVGLQWTLWQRLLAAGLTWSSSAYASVFYGLTAFHALHVAIGVLGLAWTAVQTWRGRYTAAWHVPLRLWTTYWHFVGIVWLIMYVTVILL